ncbi:hypothetical protein RYA05_06165 [Pseudomonas syringae pv. actinidiae]|uniref:hypothetical protein n=1 Tax=Pseudomonas viridiflava TaxID=33069 RepID=UPI0018E5BFD4|nr:hypothetical protein [Pseudomonas viridiflava]MBI6727325.1 hypothetical protein [Pseudomonas viridiflava]MDU8351470.1 hypothetical protein [Pseudomonas syringae pv. actinidiae]
MPLTDDEALGLKLNQQVAMGKRIFTVVRHETISGFKEPVLVDQKGERLSCVLYVAHILNHYTPPAPKAEEKKEDSTATPSEESQPKEEFKLE